MTDLAGHEMSSSINDLPYFSPIVRRPPIPFNKLLWIYLSICYVIDLRTNGHLFAYSVENTLRQGVIYQTTSNQKYIKRIHLFLKKVHLPGLKCWRKVSTRTQNCQQLALLNPKGTKGYFIALIKPNVQWKILKKYSLIL